MQSPNKTFKSHRLRHDLFSSVPKLCSFFVFIVTIIFPFSLHSSPFFPFSSSLPSSTFSLSSSPSSSSYHLDMLLLSLFWRMNGVNAEFCEISKRSTMKSMRDLNWIWRKFWLVQRWSLSSNRWPFHPFWGKLVLISITSLYLSSLDYIARQKKRTESQTMIIISSIPTVQ